MLLLLLPLLTVGTITVVGLLPCMINQEPSPLPRKIYMDHQ